MITDNNTIRDLDTDSIGISIPKEHYEDELDVKIPNDTWNRIVENYNHGWDEDLRVQVLKTMERFMMDFVEGELEKIELDSIDYSGSTLFKNPHGFVYNMEREFGSFGMNVYYPNKRNDITLLVFHRKEKDSFYSERDRWEYTSLYYRFTKVDKNTFNVEVYTTEQCSVTNTFSEPLYTLSVTWKTIREWLRKNNTSKEILQRFWKELMVPSEFKSYMDDLKKQDDEEMRKGKELSNTTEYKIELCESNIRFFEGVLQRENEKSEKYQESVVGLKTEKEKLNKLKTQLEKENK
jgi:hypothetical protein